MLEQTVVVYLSTVIENGLSDDVSAKMVSADISKVSSCAGQKSGISISKLSHSSRSIIVVKPCTVDSTSKLSHPYPPTSLSSPFLLTR